MDTVHQALTEADRSFGRITIPQVVIDASAMLEQYNPAHQARWAQRAFEALASLDRYAAASQRPENRFNGSFYTFCCCSTGASISARMVKLTESRGLMNNSRLAAMRYFPVAAEVHEREEAVMESHIAIQLVGNPAPRMYFLDDARGPTGKIHIGYVGKHLDNKKTSSM